MKNRKKYWCLSLALLLAANVQAQDTQQAAEVSAQLQVAQSVLESGDAERARDLFRSVLEAQPDLFEAHLGLGRAYLLLGEEARALIELENVLHLDNLPPDLHGQAKAYADAKYPEIYITVFLTLISDLSD